MLFLEWLIADLLIDVDEILNICRDNSYFLFAASLAFSWIKRQISPLREDNISPYIHAYFGK